MKNWMMFFIFLCALNVFISCSRPIFPESGILDHLQILGMVSDQPEIDAGATVSITPYISDAKGGGRKLFFTAEICMKAQIQSTEQEDFGCVHSAFRQILNNDTLVTPLKAPNYTGAANAISVTVPSNEQIFSGKSDRDAYNGVVLDLLYSLYDENGKQAQSIHRVLVSTRPVKNKNPQISDLLLNGAIWISHPKVKSFITPLIVSGSEELFSFKTANEKTIETKENLTLSWFTTHGRFSYGHTQGAEMNEFDPDLISSMPVSIVVVIRDARGGMTVRELTL